MWVPTLPRGLGEDALQAWVDDTGRGDTVYRTLTPDSQGESEQEYAERLRDHAVSELREMVRGLSDGDCRLLREMMDTERERA